MFFAFGSPRATIWASGRFCDRSKKTWAGDPAVACGQVPDSINPEALSKAANGGYDSMVRCLVEKGANPVDLEVIRNPVWP